MVPYVEEMRRIVRIPEVDLGLYGVLRRRAGGLERRQELLANKVLRLAPDLVAAPAAVGRNVSARIGVSVNAPNHLPGNEHEITGRDRRNETRPGWCRYFGRRNAFRLA